MKKHFLGVVLAMMAYAPLTHASIQISYQETSPAGAQTLCATGTDAQGNAGITCSAALTGVNLSLLSASSNSPGTGSLSQQFGDTLQISTTQAVTVKVWFAAQDFTQLVAPPAVSYSSSLSITSTTGTGTVGLMGCVDTANGLAPPAPGVFCSGVGSTTLTNATESYSGSSSVANTVTTSIASLGKPYSLAEVVTLTLAAGSNVNVITSQVLTVPEPTSIVLLGSALLGITMLVRKKAASRS